jgi:amyloid beta precursor protein binding protein 1
VALIDEDIKFFNKFKLVIASQLPQASKLKLAAHLYKEHIPLLLLRSNGLLGHIRLAVPEYTAIETHPTDDRSDLYIHPKQISTFPELEEYVKSFGDITTLANKEHGEVPFPVILQLEIQKWQKEHDGKVPDGWDETEAFKKQVEKASRDIVEEANFAEAVEYARKVYQEPKLQSEVEEVFNDERAEKLTKDSKPFWILVRAVNEFVKKEGKGTLPASPAIPDMTASTVNYVKIQELFRSRSERDAKAVSAHVASLLKTIGNPSINISQDYINLFLKNLRGAHFAKLRSIGDEYDSKTFRADEVNELLEEVSEVADGEKDEEDENASLPNPNPVHYYLGLRAAEIFHNKHGRDPGGAPKTGEVDVKADVKELTSIAKAFTDEFGVKTAVEASVIQELVRGGGEEVHNIAAVIGGIASQEALKVLLSQYVVANNTILFNGIHGASSTWEL